MSAPDYVAMFGERRKCFAALLELSRRQSGLVETDDYTELLNVLGKKQQIIGHLEEVGSRRPHLWQEWRRDRDRLPKAARQACEISLAESESLLAELMEHERVSTETLARRRDETRRELQSVTSGVRVNHEYRDSLAPVTHRHLDVGQ